MIKCPICKVQTNTLLTERLRRGTGKVYYCKDCDIGFLENIILDTKDYYDSQYRKEYSHKAEKNETNPQEIYEIYVNYQVDRLNTLNKYQQNKNNFLEIGASAGQFIAHIQHTYKNIYAIELDSNCCKFINNKFQIQTESDYLENSIFYKKNYYGTVTAFQVLEHTVDPVQFLKNIFTILEKDGIALIEVPNLYDPLLSVWNVSHYKTFYYHSAHNFYFSEKSLVSIAKIAGFKILDTLFFQDYNILNHINWILNDSPQNDCILGLNSPVLNGSDQNITSWLNKELELLNMKYFKKLSDAKKTSNILMVLQK